MIAIYRRFHPKSKTIASIIYLLKAIAIAMSLDLGGDLFNDIFSMGLLKVIASTVSLNF